MSSEDEIILEFILQEELQNNEQQQQEVVQSQEQADENNNDSEEKKDSGRVVPDFGESSADDLIFIEERNITLKSGVFNTPDADNAIGDFEKLPIHASGRLVDAIIIADSPDYSIKVEVDEHNILSDTYSYIDNISGELSRVAAYKDAVQDSQYVLHVTDYSFSNRFHLQIRPDEESINFSLIRIEVETDVK